MKSQWLVVGIIAIAICGCRSARPPVALSTIQPAGSLSQDDVGRGRQQAGCRNPTSIPGVRQVGFQQDDQFDDPVIAQPGIEPGDEFGQNVSHDVSTESQQEITLADLEQMALNNNPSVTQVQAEIEALRGKLTQAGLPPNPKVGIAGDDINEDGGAGRYGVFFGREIVRGNKLNLSRSVVCAEIQVAQQRLAVIQQRLLTDVRQRYYELLVAQETVAVATDLLEVSQFAFDTSTKLFDAKEAARTAVLQSKLELQNATVVKRQAENRRLAARRKLAGLLGESDLPASDVVGDVRQIISLQDFELAFDQLIYSSPEIAALFAEVDRARRQLARECVEPIPNVTWQTTFQYGTFVDDLIAGFQVGMPIPTVNRNQGAIHQARHQITVAQREAEKKALDLRQRLATAYEFYLDAKLQVDAFNADILPTAKATFELVSQGYEQGEIDFLQLLTAQRSYTQTNLNYLQNLRQLWQQHVEIQGMLLKGSFQ